MTTPSLTEVIREAREMWHMMSPRFRSEVSMEEAIAKSLLAAGMVGEGWRPIDDEAKTGAPMILLSAAYTKPADEWSSEIYHGPRVAIGQWNAQGDSWADKYGSLDGDAHHLEVTGTWSSEGGWFQPNEVTHYMPLPAPPRTTP